MSDDKNTDKDLSLLIYFGGFTLSSILIYKVYVKALQFYSLHETQLKYGFYTALLLSAVPIGAYIRNKYLDHLVADEKAKCDDKTLVGISKKTKRPVYIQDLMRLYHTQVIGSTGTGKTEGIVLPWIFRDIEQGNGMLIIDGKPEEQFLARLYGKVSKEGREKNFRLFSLARPEFSNCFNPFAYGESDEIAERVFSSFQTENSHYKALQKSAFTTVIELIKSKGMVPKAGLVRELLRDKDLLAAWTNRVEDPILYSDLEKILKLSSEQFQKDFSGILAYLENLTKNKAAHLLNQSFSDINFEEALLNNNIIYFQLPTLSSPDLASNIGRLAIQTFAAAAGAYQARTRIESKKTFSLYLDDFNDYMYEGFVSVPNKVRSAGIGMVFSHQSLGDLEKVSPEFRKVILDNTNNKVIFRMNDPESADYFSALTGTEKTEITTERRTNGFLGPENTGEQSVKDGDKYKTHPNVLKDLLTLEAAVIIHQTEDTRIIDVVKCKPVPFSSGFLPKEKPKLKMNYVAEARVFGDGKSTSSKAATVSQKNSNEYPVPPPTNSLVASTLPSFSQLDNKKQ